MENLPRPSVDNTSKPSDRSGAGSSPSMRLYIVAAALSLIGLADTIYLTVKHLTGQTVQCTVSNGCEEVLSSTYSTFLGYPLAAFGLFAYFTVFSLAILAIFGYRYTRVLLMFLVGLMTLMTLRLLYLQAFVLGKYCEFCLLSAAVTLSLAVVMLAIAFGSESKSVILKKTVT